MLNELEVKHDTKCDGRCHAVEFDESVLVDTLKNGSNPGIAMHVDEMDNVSCEVVNALDHPFVAISHVW